ncbi:MAG: transport-associated protein [Ramlibacter sp.]|jgi:osmotically-inducible protein OsmY|nr:transport-associated protein [Ramlibacter sp.]MCE3270568.1 transport-associated protein [Ramlibacter sp.]
MNTKRAFSFPCASLAAALLAAALAGCAPLIVGGAAVGSMIMVNDRRTSGAQIDDETIEYRGASRLRDAFGDRAHINITSYNRQVLLTGEVPNETVKQQAEQVISRMDAVRAVVNELAVMAPTTLGQRSADVLITGKVRASFVDASDLQAIHYKVVTERATVYLMGRVTAREADRATQIARQVGGVQRVVRIFEMLDERAAPAPVTTVTPAPAPASAAPAPEPQPAAPAGAISTPVR